MERRKRHERRFQLRSALFVHLGLVVDVVRGAEETSLAGAREHRLGEPRCRARAGRAVEHRECQRERRGEHRGLAAGLAGLAESGLAGSESVGHDVTNCHRGGWSRPDRRRQLELPHRRDARLARADEHRQRDRDRERRLHRDADGFAEPDQRRRRGRAHAGGPAVTHRVATRRRPLPRRSGGQPQPEPRLVEAAFERPDRRRRAKQLRSGSSCRHRQGLDRAEQLPAADRWRRRRPARGIEPGGDRPAERSGVDRGRPGLGRQHERRPDPRRRHLEPCRSPVQRDLGIVGDDQYEQRPPAGRSDRERGFDQLERDGRAKRDDHPIRVRRRFGRTGRP